MKKAVPRRLEPQASQAPEGLLYSTIIESAIEGVCVCEGISTAPGIFVSLWNRRMDEITGYTVEEVNRLGWFETIYREPAAREQAEAMVARVAYGEKPEAIEMVITRKDGSKRNVLVSTQPLLVPGQTPRVFGIMHDITDRVRLEARLRDAQRIEAIGRLAGAVAHDFNNLLTSILGGASILKDVAGMSDTGRTLAEDIEAAAERGADLTRQLLTFSRGQRPETRTLDLAAQVGQTLRVVRRLLDSAGEIEISAELEPGLRVNGDPGMIDQVVMNLAVNALDAMPNGGGLSVIVRRASVEALARLPEADGEYALLEVTDTGHGIPDDVRPHVFEPFFTTKPTNRGTGLGLSTVYGIVTQHRGQIEVASAPPQGSSFRVFLPLSTTDVLPVPAAAEAPIPHRALTVLLVDDLETVRRVTRHVLESLGHEVVEAGTAEEALEVWKERGDGIGVVVTDVRLGKGLTGPQLADSLRRQGATVPVVLMSGFDPEGGATPEGSGLHFLPKPFDRKTMAATLGRLVS